MSNFHTYNTYRNKQIKNKNYYNIKFMQKLNLRTIEVFINIKLF